MDWRTLVLARVALGAVVLFDARSRVLEACDHFADDGVFPRSAALAQQHGSWALNVFLLSGSCWVARAVMIAYALAGIALVAGFRPRIATAIGWLITFSMQGRNPWVHDGGDLYLRNLLFWGDHGSLDNCLRRDYAMAPNMAAGLARRLDSTRGSDPPPQHPPGGGEEGEGPAEERPATYCTPGTVAFLLQYVETYLEKTGPEWVWEDSALYYALSLDQFALPAARVLLQYPTALLVLSRASFLLEGFAGPLLLALDGGWRCLVIASVILFHWGTSVTLLLGPFPFICMAAVLAFLPRSTWAWAEAVVQTPEAAASRLVVAPSTLPSSATARALTLAARACLLGRGGPRRTRVVHAAELSPAQRAAWGVDKLGVGWQWALIATDPSQPYSKPVAVSGGPALWQLATFLPLAGPLLCWSARAAKHATAWARRARERLGRSPAGTDASQGSKRGPGPAAECTEHMLPPIRSDAAHLLAACADVLQHSAPAVHAPLQRAVSRVKGEVGKADSAAAAAWALLTLARRRPGPHPLVRRARRTVQAAGQAFVAVCMLYVVWWTTVQLQEVPGPHNYPNIGLPPPTHRKLFVELLGLSQRWNMFSPGPSRYDGWFVMEAKTSANRTVDLWPIMFSEGATEWEAHAPTWDSPEFPAHHFPSTKWHKYMNNYFLPEAEGARGHFGAWLCNRFPWVRYARVVFITSVNLGFRRRGLPTPYSVSNHNCQPESHGEWEEHNRRTDSRFVFALPQWAEEPISFADAVHAARFPAS